MRSHKITL